MKNLWKLSLLIILFSSVLLNAQSTEARILFKAEKPVEINLEKLNLTKEMFFAFVTTSVHTNPFGLQAYGQVPFRVCDFKLDNRDLFDYKTVDGRLNRFLSNPSCDQIVLLRLLENSYQYRKDNLSPYENRSCILSMEKIFSPLLEYYTIHYEEKSKAECIQCDRKEQTRMDRIAVIQDKIVQDCGKEQGKVVQFLKELDEVIENAFKTKKVTPPK
ncbi:MAG: hypothetical protein ABIK68_11905 [bacterium]